MRKEQGESPEKTAAPAAGAGLAAVTDLVGRFGPATRRFSVALAALSAEPIDLDGLIRCSGLSRRTIEELLAAAGPDLETQGHRYRLRPDRRATYEQQFGYQEASSPGASDPREIPGSAIRAVTELIRRGPPDRSHLDHVAATPETLVRRASWLGRTYDLRRSRLVFVGDHDLTSLATGLLHPEVDAQVVDIDEDLLVYLEAEARRLGLGLRCSYADLRYGLPRDPAGWGDVIFTDPPYSPEGVALFAERGLEALRDREFGQLVIAYGFSERQPTAGWKVQQALSNLGLVFEAVLPDFNTYLGAQAVGSTSDLYVCRPTSRSWRLPRQTDRLHIYTRGRQSAEALSRPLSPALRDAAVEAASGKGGSYVVVSDRWAGSETARHLRLGTLFENGVPPASATQTTAGIVDLADDPGPWLLRSLLAINLQRVVLILPEGHPEASGRARRRLEKLLEDKYRLGEPRKVDVASPFFLLEVEEQADRVDPADQLRRAVLRRAHGNLLNAWREGLISLARQRGQTLTKNEARAVLEAFAGQYWPTRLIDFPRHQIAELLAALGHSTATLERHA